jgi:hypothetical protein
MWLDGFVRPPGSPVNGDQLQQKRVTAIITPDGTGFGVDSDNAYHGPGNNVTDATATEYLITSSNMSGGSLAVAGKVIRAVDPGNIGNAVSITLSLGAPVGACKYSNGSFSGDGLGTILHS